MRRATRDDVPALVRVLARAFDDDPCQKPIPGGPTVWSMWRDPVRR